MSSGSDRTLELLDTLAPLTQFQAWHLVNAARLAGIPLIIISGARSAELNRDVGGAAKSYHLSGNAFDVAVWGYSRDQIPWEWWNALGVWATQNLRLFWGGHVVHAGELDVNHFDSRLMLTRV